MRNPDINDKHIALVYANDIWVADRSGNSTQRLTSFPGIETNPHFSPDGKLIDFTRALVKLSENDTALGQVWHIPNATTITTRQLVELVEKEIGQPIEVRAAGGLMVTVLGLFNPMLKEMKEMMYEWEQPYIVDHSKFEQAFGADVAPHELAIKETVAWYREWIG